MRLNRFLKMTNKSKFNNIAIIGLGLIGSSVALAIKKNKKIIISTGSRSREIQEVQIYLRKKIIKIL